LKTLAVALAVGTAATLVTAMVAPSSAQAGIGGALKSAAKSVGGVAKTTVKAVGGAAKTVGSGVKTTVTHPSRIVSVAKAGAVGVKQVGGKVLSYVPGYKGASGAVKAAIDGKVKWR
jgi:hypothetical protein